MENIILRKMFDGEENTVSTLIEEVFNEFIAPEYSEEGINKFKNHFELNSLLSRKENGSIFTVAVDKEKIIGIVEIRDLNHISLFFVNKKYHGNGIGGILIKRAIKESQNIYPNIKTFTVNSSSYAKKVYEKLGFNQTQEEQIKNGLRFIPMELLLVI